MNCCNSVDIKRRKGFPGGVEGKELPADSGDVDLIPGSGRPPGRRKWQPTLVFLPGKFQGQRSLAGYTVCGVTRSWLQMSTNTRRKGSTLERIQLFHGNVKLSKQSLGKQSEIFWTYYYFTFLFFCIFSQKTMSKFQWLKITEAYGLLYYTVIMGQPAGTGVPGVELGGSGPLCVHSGIQA